MADLTVLVPTRGRIKNALRLLEAFRSTCAGDTELIFVISADDQLHDDYYWHLTQAGARAVTVEVDRKGVVAPLNAAYGALRDDLGYAVGYMGDDHLPRTQGWDSELLSSLRSMGTGVAYPNDQLQHDKMATSVVMTSDIPKTLGFMAPPELDHMCIDLVWLDWGRGIDKLVYRDDVVVEHLHRSVGKASDDATYGLSKHLVDPDSEKYHAYKEKSLSGDLKALNGLLKPAPKKRAPRKAKTNE